MSSRHSASRRNRDTSIEKLVADTFNNIFYSKKLRSAGGRSLEQDILASYIADDNRVPEDKRLYRGFAHKSFMETCRREKSGGARFRKPRLRKDKLRELEPNNAAIMAGILYRGMFRDKSLLEQLRHAHDGNDIKALLSIDYMLDKPKSPDIKRILDSDWCIESKALQIVELVGGGRGPVRKREMTQHQRSRRQTGQRQAPRRRPTVRRVPHHTPSQPTRPSQPVQRYDPPLPMPYLEKNQEMPRTCGGIEMEDEPLPNKRLGVGRMIACALGLVAYLIAGGATINEVMEDKVVKHENKVFVGTMFNSTSYPLDYIYFSDRAGCRDISRALAGHIDSTDKQEVQSIIEYNSMPDRRVCLGEMVRIPQEMVKGPEKAAGLVEGAVVPELDRNHSLLFPDTYYQCRGERYRTVAKRVSGSSKSLEKKVERIKQYNTSHNPQFSHYSRNSHCYGRIMVPPSSVNQKRWIHRYISGKTRK